MTLRDHLEAVLLDWDGTLLDSFEADTAAYLQMFRALGVGWGPEELERHYSPDWYQVYRAARIPRDRWKDADLLWRRAYENYRPKLVSGARQVLRRLGARYRLGLVTSGDSERVISQLRRLRLTSRFVVRVCHEDTPRPKPHPAPLLAALGRMRLDPAVAVYVGDAPEDVEMARRAGVRAVGVLGSFPTAHRLRASRPDVLLDSLRELPALLESWSGAPRRR
jgi:HAD superfamily hydrolase (TIGR01549 family)